MKREHADVEATVRGERYLVKTLAHACDKCRHVALEGEDVPEYMRQGADAYRKAHGLLASSEIQERRRALRMNQRQFAAYLGVGEASLKRWELGQIQDAAMNELIVLKTDVAAAQRNLTEISFRIAASAAPDFEAADGQFKVRPRTLYQVPPPGSGHHETQERKAPGQLAVEGVA